MREDKAVGLAWRWSNEGEDAEGSGYEEVEVKGNYGVSPKIFDFLVAGEIYAWISCYRSSLFIIALIS